MLRTPLPIQLFQPLELPSGQVISNRVAKAAMEEGMADADQLPGADMVRLYSEWAFGGAGLILTGNFMVDAEAVTGPGAVVLDARQPLEPFERLAEAVHRWNARIWAQINHPGRQVYVATSTVALGPSAVPVDIKGFSHLFAKPREMTEEEIATVIERFAETAFAAERAGFDGVEIHAAHGYLLNQFLSPRINIRTDRWGGSLENRARLLLDVVQAVREVVAPTFGVGVKLNSSDFQKGGFEPEDAAQVVQWLNEMQVDLVEISGGSYESPAMQGSSQIANTREREAYFIEFAKDIAQVATMPVMVTGGIRRRAVAEAALASEGFDSSIAMVGIGQALAYAPDLPRSWQTDARDIAIPRVSWKQRPLANLATMSLARLQLRRIGRGRAPKPTASPLLTLMIGQLRTKRRNKLYHAWLKRRRAAVPLP